MTEEEQSGRWKPEETPNAPMEGGTAGKSGHAAERTEQENKRYGKILTVALAFTMVGMSFLKQFIRKPRGKTPRGRSSYTILFLQRPGASHE